MSSTNTVVRLRFLRSGVGEIGGSGEGQKILGKGGMCRCLSGVGGVVARDLDPDNIGEEGGGDCDRDRERYGHGEEFRSCVCVEERSED